MTRFKKALDNCGDGAQRRARTEQTRQSLKAQHAKLSAEKAMLLQTASQFALGLQAKLVSSDTVAMGSGAMGSGGSGGGGGHGEDDDKPVTRVTSIR